MYLLLGLTSFGVHNLVIAWETLTVMTPMEQGYVAWIAQTTGCDACGHACPAAAQKHLVNENIPANPRKIVVGLPIVPQSGFLGPDYERQEKRILVLGKNPGGNWDTHRYYACQDEIAKASDGADDLGYRSAMDRILGMVQNPPDWKLLRDVNLFQSLPATQIAYANQILCRMVGPASDIEKADAKGLEAIYASCFEHRVLPLIHLLRPNHIIAFGAKRWESWPDKLAAFLREHPECGHIEVHGVIFPFGRHRKTAMKHLESAITQITATSQD
jgi:hypothetical protein